MFTVLIVLILLVLHSAASADITFEPASVPADVSVEALTVEGTEYHLLSVKGFDIPMDIISDIGLPSLPFTETTFLLPPNTRIDGIEILSTDWDTIPGNYHLYPVQTGIMTDTVFIPPDSIIYNSNEPFPAQPVEVSRQGSAMGYSVVTIAGTPIRYIPADGTIMVLTSITLDIRMGPSESELIIPNRETEWSAAMRKRGILSLVSDPDNLGCYQQPVTVSFRNRAGPLNITLSPSSEGDGVDMVIVTSEELVSDFEQVANYRTQRGIITVIRTVEWINQFYSGCDSPERIRNFIRDAHQEWGIQAILLGGDNDVVPIRECNGWDYAPGPFPIYQFPSDDYYADIDGNWSLNGSTWTTELSTSYLDLCIGRWPVNSSNDVDVLFTKLKLYEQPDEFPEDFARKLLLIGSNIPEGNGADDMMKLVTQLQESSAIPIYLDEPTELYYPHSLPAGDLCRNATLDELDQGYNLIIHADHSGIHKLATAGKNALGQYIWDSDFATMNNLNEPSILWTLGCDPGHFDGANCFAEAGLFTSDSSGLVAAIANARIGIFGQKATYYAFCDALFNTCRIDRYGYQSNHWPLSFLGEANRYSKNYSGISFLHMNLLGSPLMYVWRDNPGELHLSVPWTLLREGVSRDISVTVTDGTDPVENATVCLWKKYGAFSIENTNAQGQVIFENVYITDNSGDQNLVITAVKQRTEIDCDETTVSNYIPDQVTLDIIPADVPIVSLENFSVDDTGDETANPNETVDIHLIAKNSGGETARNVSAQLLLVSGGEYIANIDDNQSCFPDIGQGQTENSTNPFTVTVNPDVESYSTVEFVVLFSYEGGSDNYQWKSPLFLTVYSEDYELTVMNSTADNSSNRIAEITLSDMLLANCGLGEGINLNITVDNLIPPAPFKVNTLFHPAIESNDVSELSGSINLTVVPDDLTAGSSLWLEKGFRGCSFDVLVSSEGGNFTARNIDVKMLEALQHLCLDPPSELRVYEAGQDYVSLHWEHGGDVDAEGFYIYYSYGDVQYRAYPLPVPVEQVTIEGLLPGSELEIEVTAVDAIGRESEPVSVSISTTCPVVDGWPIQLAGSPGGGPAIADIDQDGSDEIIVATSFGVVYIIRRNGSYQKLYPPQGYDFDRFLGCAVGDVDGDSQLEIVVSCQKEIEVENSEQLAILLFDRSSMSWTADEIATTEVNEQAASPNIAGTPVLFQADNSMALEIALRTRGNNGGTPHLYAWRYDPDIDTWVNYSEDFPVNLLGCYYSMPSAVDFDEDGFEELIVTTYGSGGVGTALIIADFGKDGSVIITEHDLPELDTEGEIARAYGTIAAAEENGTYYITGSAKSNVLCSTLKRVFTYRLESDPAGVTFLWKTRWMSGNDFYGNMPGPSIGNLDDDPDLEVIYTLNDGEYCREGVIYSWDLDDGSVEFQSANIPFNPITGDGGACIKSQPVVGLTTSPGSREMAVFAGFSTLCCGFDPRTGSSILEGFPAWSRDGSWGAPALCDLNSDGSPEVLYIDYSGYAMLFDWYEGSYTSDGWHMYQDNPFRNGFYNTAGNRGGLDIRIAGRPHMVTEGNTDVHDFRLLAEVEITGYRDIQWSEMYSASISASVPASERAEFFADNESPSSITAVTLNDTRNNPVNRSSISASVIPYRPLEIAAFCQDRHIGSAIIGLDEGSHMVEIPLKSGNYPSGDITVIADPFNTYRETDETNNSCLAESIVIPGTSSEVIIPSPAETIELIVTLPSTLPDGVRIRVYSIDGRLITSLDTEELHSGTSNVLPDRNSGTDRLPAGMYTVWIEGLDSGDVIKRVIILGH